MDNKNKRLSNEQLIYKIRMDKNLSPETKMFMMFKLYETGIVRHSGGTDCWYIFLEWKDINIRNIFIPDYYKDYFQFFDVPEFFNKNQEVE
jgi:hypothetical protein